MAYTYPTIDTTAGAGDSGKAGGDKLNAAFRQLETAMPLNQVTRIITEGDSISVDMASFGGQSPLFWATSMFPVSFVHNGIFGSDAFGIGSTQTSDLSSPMGMTHPTRLANIATRIKTVRAAGERPLVIIQAGTNDVGNSWGDNASPSTLANIRKMVNNMLSAGASHIIIMSIDPRVNADTSSAGLAAAAVVARQVTAVNAGLAELCRQLPERLTFCDTQAATADATNALFLPQGADGEQGVHRDTLHPTVRGAYFKGRVLGPILRRLLPHRRSLIPPAGSVQSSSSLRGNILGLQGRLYDIGAQSAQYSGIAVADTASFTGGANLPSAKLNSNYPNFSAALSGTQTLEITQQPWPVAVQELGRTDIPCTRFRFAGTPTTSGFLKMSIAENRLTAYDIAAGPYECEALMYLDKLKGLRGVGLVVTADGAGGRTYGSPVASTTSTPKVLPEITGLMDIYAPSPLTAASKPSIVTFDTGVMWNAGYEFSGDLYLFGAYVGQNIPLVAATA